MCGIAGYIRPTGLLDERVLAGMNAALRHRGPDGDGAWADPSSGVALAHTRLKVLDLTDAAHQPMISDDGRVALVFNGEIYNHRPLRDALIAGGAVFHSTGDTAVLLELCRRDPDLTFLPRLNGMFAFAVWNADRRSLTLARDRTGVKPLLYAEFGASGGLAFASEMRALRIALDGASSGGAKIDPFAVTQLVMMGFFLAPRTVFNGVHRLPPGHTLTWTESTGVTTKRWTPDPPGQSPVRSFGEARERLRTTMRDAVRTRLLADVPVGLFLSGGIDSSVITAIAAQLGGPTVRTFSVGFPGQAFFDETPYSDAVAKRYATEHTTLPLTLDEIRDAIPTVLDHISEPFADSSALPTYLLSRLTRHHVTVALSGDGADELFAGYRRYAAARLIRRLGWFARSPLYGPMRRWVEGWPARRETWVGSRVSQLKRALRGLDPDRRRRYANWQRITDDAALATLLPDPRLRESFVARCLDDLWAQRGSPRDSDDLNAHLGTEWRTSLPDDMLMKVDLASMAHGLEVRSPFLDFNVADLVQPLPADWKMKGWKKKHLLIEAYRDDLPAMLHNRPKKGFEVPVGPWLRGPLFDMACDLINADRLFFSGLFSRDAALNLLSDHRAGRADHTTTLWALVTLLWWQQRQAPNATLGITEQAVVS
jgi:asparagine synthase (glutamine-hydrolysing)